MWEHRNYDSTYMGMEPERAFDYLAWKRAGHPMGDDLASWESAHLDAVVPIRRAHQLAVCQLKLALHKMAEWLVEADVRSTLGP